MSSEEKIDTPSFDETHFKFYERSTFIKTFLERYEADAIRSIPGMYPNYMLPENINYSINEVTKMRHEIQSHPDWAYRKGQESKYDKIISTLRAIQAFRLIEINGPITELDIESILGISNEMVRIKWLSKTCCVCNSRCMKGYVSKHTELFICETCALEVKFAVDNRDVPTRPKNEERPRQLLRRKKKA